MPVKNPKQIGDRRLRQEFFTSMAQALKRPIAAVEEHLSHLPARSMPTVEVWIRDALLDAQTDPVRIPNGAGAPQFKAFVDPEIIKQQLASQLRGGVGLNTFYRPIARKVLETQAVAALDSKTAYAVAIALGHKNAVAFNTARYVEKHLQTFTIRIDHDHPHLREFDRVVDGTLKFMFYTIADKEENGGVYRCYLLDMVAMLAAFKTFGQPRVATNPVDDKEFYVVPFNYGPGIVLWEGRL